MHIYHEEIWQDPVTNYWFSNDLSEICSGAEKWEAAALVLNLSLVDYVKLLIEKFNTIVEFNEEYGFLYYKWETKESATQWKNYINKIAKNKKIYFTR